MDLLKNADDYNGTIKFNKFDESDKSETAVSRRERLWENQYYSRVTDFTNLREFINQ